MPLTDRPEFQSWLAHHEDRKVGHPHGELTACMKCGADLDHEISAHECLPCLAEQFGIETAELWIADILSGFIQAAAAPAVLAHLLAEIVPFARDVIEHHTTLPATA